MRPVRRLTVELHRLAAVDPGEIGLALAAGLVPVHPRRREDAEGVGILLVAIEAARRLGEVDVSPVGRNQAALRRSGPPPARQPSSAATAPAICSRTCCRGAG